MTVTLVNTANVFDDATLKINGAWGVTSVVLNGTPYLYVSGIADSGISAFTISSSGQLTNVSGTGGNVPDNGAATELFNTIGLMPLTLGANTYLYAAAYGDFGLDTLQLNSASGAMTHLSFVDDVGLNQLAGAIDMVSVTIGADTHLYAVGILDDGLSHFYVNSATGALLAGAGASHHFSELEAGTNAHSGLDNARSIATAAVGGVNYLFVAAQLDNAISVFSIAGDGSMVSGQIVTDDPILQIAQASAVTTATVAGKVYVFVGGSEGISVFSLASGGTLTNVFNVADDATLHISGATDLVAAEIDGTTYLFAAAQNEDGVSVFAVAADGSLVNMGNIRDTRASALDGASSLATVVVDGETFLAVTGSADNGVSLFRVDTTGLTIVGTENGDVVDATNAPAGELLPGSLDDTIFGLGGGDTLSGLKGNDTIHGDGGTDNLYGGDGNDRLFGGAEGDLLDGGAGNDTLDGGTADDTMRGGIGNDTYFVDNAADLVEEASGQGTDTVNSSISFSLASQYIENLNLTGALAINGTGNSLNNTIRGNSANNIINGGTGADRMEGGGGDDRYYVDNAGDVVVEASGAGNDRVVSTVSFNLSGQYIERLTLDGTANISGTGNSQNNGITGNSGNNTLNGGTGNDTLEGGGGTDTLNGQAGDDTLTGGTGADFFVFNTALSASTNVDTITDFQVNVDKMRLENAIFAVGADLASNEFLASTSGTATTSTQRILYDTTDGRLFYDPDGNGAQARIHFATLDAGLALDHLDFVVI